MEINSNWIELNWIDQRCSVENQKGAITMDFVQQ